MSIEVEGWAALNDVSFLKMLNTQVMKKHAATFIGEPKASRGKEHTIIAAERIKGSPVISGDEADGIMIAHHASIVAKEEGQHAEAV